MYVNIPSLNTPVISLDVPTNSSLEYNFLSPKVISYQKTTDRNGESDIFLELQMYCQIDGVNYLQNKKNSQALTPTKIEIRLSKNSVTYYQNKGKQTAFDAMKTKIRNQKNNPANPKRQKPGNLNRKFLSAAQTLTVTDSISQFSIDKKNNLYNDALLVGYINIDKNIIQGTMTTKKLIAEKINNKYQEKIEKNTTLDSRAFKYLYNSMIEMNDDPAKIFQDGFLKTSFKDKKGGLSNLSNKQNDKYQKIFKPIYENIKQSINTIALMQYQITTANVEERLQKVGTKIQISLSKLRSFGQSFHVILLSKNKKGIIIEAKSYIVNIKDIENQIIENSTEYSLSPTRLNTGVSVLNIGSKSAKKTLDVNLHAKRVKIQKPFDMCYYSSLGNIKILPNETAKIQDGVYKGTTLNPSNFKRSESIFYRTTLNYKQKNYANAKSVSDKSKFKNEMIPHLSIVGRVTSNAINLEILNISENVEAVRPRKYVFKGDTPSKSDLRYIYTSSLPEENFTQVKGTGVSIRYKDIDVFRTSNYMYVVECIMKNGEKKLASAYFIEKFEERSGAVQIKNINYTTINTDNYSSETDLGSIGDISDIKRKINVSFDVTKIESEADKILKNMFGDLFELFKDKLQTIRDIQSVVYSIDVSRIDHATGQFSSIIKVTPDEDGNCTFVDSDAPLYSSVTYKFTPRITPTADLISFVNEQISTLGKSTIFNSGRYTRAATYRQREKSRQRIVSTTANKFSKRNAFLKGLIETPAYSTAQQGTDFSFGNSTGDITYVEIPGINASDVTKNITISNPEIILIDEEFNLQDKYNNHRINATNLIKERKTLLFDLSFDIVGNDNFVDFYAFFIRENNDVYLDGIMHSNDTYSQKTRYSYLVKHRGSFGVVEYFIVPFYKNGDMGSPKFITANKIF